VARKRSTPNTRAGDKKKEIDKIRRRYSKNTRKHVKLLPAEVPHVEQMVAILKLANYSQVQIARIIGISREQVKGMLDSPKLQKEIALLREKIPAAAIELLQDLMIEAVITYADVMRTSDDDAIRIRAAGEILDRGGMPKLSKQERVEEHRTTVTDDGLVDRLRETSPEIQEEAAQIIERLEELLRSSPEEVVDDSDD
jgi:hypothetical protein